VRLEVHGKSKYGGECTAARKICPVFHFCIYDVRENGLGREFSNRYLFSDEATCHVDGSVGTGNARQRSPRLTKIAPEVLNDKRD
jgi:hypothetical protein